MAPALHPVLGSRMFLKSDSHLKELLGKTLTSPVLPAALLAVCCLPGEAGMDARAAGSAVFSLESPCFSIIIILLLLLQHSVDQAGLRLKAIFLS